jgi:hypothetical protein
MDTRRAMRRQLLAIVARRQRPGSGSDLRALDVRRTFMDWWAEAEQALAALPHAVAGAVATNAYAPERATRDIDMVVLAREGPRAQAALSAAGWQRLGPLGAGVRGTTWRHPAGYELDLIELTEPWASEAIEAAKQNRIAGMPTLTMPYLILMKLLSARTIDLADITRMLGRASTDQAAKARALIARLGTREDVTDFDRLRRMGLLERQRGEGGDPKLQGGG